MLSHPCPSLALGYLALPFTGYCSKKAISPHPPYSGDMAPPLTMVVGELAPNGMGLEKLSLYLA